MAVWVLNTGQSHTAWRELTRIERKALEDAAEEVREQIKSRRK